MKDEDDIDWSGAEKAAKVGQDEPSMDDALEKARSSGGKDTFGVVSSLGPSHIEEAVKSLEQPDRHAAEAVPAGPTYGPVEPPPPEPPSVAPPPDAPDFNQYTAPAEKPADPIRQQRISAIESIRKLIDSGPPQIPAGMGDEDIAAARKRDEQAQARSDFSRALIALGARKPFESEPVKSEADSLLRQRAGAQAQGAADLQRKLAGQETIAKLSEGSSGITPYQQAELAHQATEDARKSDERKTALAGRKRTMLSLYPDHKAEIEGLTDLGDAQTLQMALEGRLGRADTQAHQDAAKKESEDFQRAQQARAEAFQKAMEEWKATHRPMTAEQATQLEGIEKSEGVLNTFEGALSEVSSAGGKAGAATGQLGAMIGLKGSDFPAARHGAATLLARGLEGGTAKPGNVEMLLQMLPESSDAENIKAKKMQHLREFMADNRDAFQRTLTQGGFRPLEKVPDRPKPPPPKTEQPKPPKGLPPDAFFMDGAWYWQENGKMMKRTEGHG